MKLAVVSGLSGAGKSVALRQYEDLGWYCVDNIPLDFLEPLVSHALSTQDPRYAMLAIGVDARGDPARIAHFAEHMLALRERGVQVDVVFLTAEDAIILKRYSETRRRHPLSDADTSLMEAIQRERHLLAPIANAADGVFDTSHLNLHELRSQIQRRNTDAASTRMAVQFLSFGFKNGVPGGIDFLFDVRNLPNPHWLPELRPLTGRDEAVVAFLQQQPLASSMLDDLKQLLGRWLPAFEAQDRSYVTIAIGCTGGQHRSVFMAETLGAFFKSRFSQVVVTHRELH